MESGAEDDGMRRREFVTAGAVVAAGLSGCLDDGNEQRDETGVVWEHDVGGNVDVVHDGTVYGREDWDGEGSGGVLALTSDGDDVWTYGETGGYSTYTRVVVGDGAFNRGVYFGKADDAIGSGDGELYALELDGAERWVRDVGSVYDPPVLHDDGVLVGTDKGVAHRFDVNGDEVWKFEVPAEELAPDVSVAGVAGEDAYVTAGGALFALDASEGDERWRYTSDDRVSTVEVDEGTVYFSQSGRIASYADGEELWSHGVEGTNSWIRGVAHGNVYFRHSFDLRAVDADDGEELWTVDMGEGYRVAFDDDTVYAGVRYLRAFAPDGNERWSVELDGSELAGISVVGDVYAVTEEGVHRITDGEVAASVELPEGTARSHVVENGRVYVGSRDGIYAVNV